MILKLVIIGDKNVGKHTIMTKFSSSKMFGNTDEKKVGINLIGIDCRTKNMIIDEKQIIVQLWNITTIDKQKKITKNYFKGTAGMVIVYDITNRESFDHAKKRLFEIYDNEKNMKVLLIGNKTDVSENRTVTYEEGKESADKYKVSFYETSNITGDINKIFDDYLGIIVKS